VSEVCRSCKAPIRWAITAGGHLMPIDPVPVPDGNLRLEQVAGGDVQVPRVRVVPPAWRTQADAGQLYRPHFASCPFADQHRRRR
jgi:hypothetical protein